MTDRHANAVSHWATCQVCNQSTLQASISYERTRQPTPMLISELVPELINPKGETK